MIVLPFAPGIPWKIQDDIIIPKLNAEVFSRAIDGKNLAIVCHGGFFESVMSLTFAEMLNLIYNKKYYWSGDNRFIDLPKISGLFALDKETNINKDNLNNYPTPLFFDNDKFVYINSLFNYRTSTSLIYMNKIKNKEELGAQIFKNSFTKWNNKYRPRFRKLQSSQAFSKWCKVNNFSLSSKYVLVIPEKIGWSIHDKSNLGWSRTQVQALASMLNLINVKVVVVSHNKMIGQNIISLQPNISDIIQLIQNASDILSEEVDFVLVGALISKARLYGRAKEKKISFVRKHTKMFKVGSRVSFTWNVKPIDVYNRLRS